MNTVFSLQMDRVIFCVFLEVDYKIYKKKMNEFFSTGTFTCMIVLKMNERKAFYLATDHLLIHKCKFYLFLSCAKHAKIIIPV